MAKSVLETIIKIVKQGGGDKETVKALADVKQSFGNVMTIMGGVVAVGATVNAVYKATAGVFIDYAARVRDMSRETGMSIEQSSRMIQMADDVKVSYESLQKALWFAAKNGVEPNIETISRLADEYVALHDPVKQADLLTKNFGKGGAEMGKLLQLGSEGIKALNAGINQNLILTERAAISARAWEIQQDQFNDTVEATKVAVGQDLIGVLTGATGEINRLALANYKAATGVETTGRAMYHLKEGEDAAWDAAKRMAEQQYIVAHSSETAAGSTLMLSEAARESADAMGENSASMQQATADAQALADQQKQVMDVAFQLQSALDSYNDTMADVDQKQKEAQATWDEAQKKYDQRLISTQELQQAEQAYNDAMAETGATAQQAAAQHQEAMNRIIFSIIQAQAAADGLTAEESKGLIQIAVQLGMVDQATADMANSMVDQFSKTGTAIRTDGIGPAYKFNEQMYIAKGYQGNYRYSFLITTSGSVPNFSGVSKGARDAGIDEFGAGGSGGGSGGYASGGQWGGEWATVGEQGMELISPTGYIFPADVTQHLLAAGLVPGYSFMMGGDFEGVFKGNGTTAERKANSSRRTTTTPSPTSKGSAATTAAVVQASQQVASASEQSAQSNAQSTKDMANVTTTAMQAAQVANESMLSEIKGLRGDLEKANYTTVQAIREAVVVAS